MDNLGYIEVKIDEVSKIFFDKLVKKICQDTDYYKSDVIDYIDGNVTHKLHLTLFYGCSPKGIKLKLLKAYVKNLSIKRLVVGDIFLLDGYENRYKILGVKIIDEGGLKKISEEVASFGYDESVIHKQFIPHLTLAYVKPDFVLPKSRRINKKFVGVESVSLKFD